MALWLCEHLGTVVVGVLLAVSVFFVVRFLVRRRKNGGGGCSCGCDGCPMSGSCENNE